MKSRIGTSQFAPKSLGDALSLLPQITEGDLRWAAGFLEADGCISIGKSGGRNMHECPLERFHILLVVVQKDPRPTKFFQSLFGGQIKKVKRSESRLYNQWIVCANRAYAALHVMRPYLKFKSSQADLAMEMQKNVNEYRLVFNRNSRLPKEVTIARREMYFSCQKLNSKSYIDSLNSIPGEFGGPLPETIPSQAAVGDGAAEGVTARCVTPKNNRAQECPAGLLFPEEIA